MSFMPKSVTFGPKIADALPYYKISQAPYPPPIAPLKDDLVATAKATSGEVLGVPSLLLFFDRNQRKTLGGLIEGVMHPDEDLLRSYV